MVLEGACHCGAVKAVFETALGADAIEVRADQCSFCKARGAKTVSDPKGKLTLHAARAHPYQFGLRTADFWICDNCGAYVAATTVIDGRTYGVLNVAGAGIAELARRDAKPVDYSAEDVAARNARRRVRWTPAEIVN
jgi:hypothetical protein